MTNFIYSKKSKFCFLVFQNISICAIAVCISVMFLFSSVPVSGIYGTYQYGIDLFDSSGQFEDTDVFYYLLSDSVDEVVRYAVIREQMETEGAFDGKKIIDVKKFAQRYEYGSSSGNLSYYLEDLIRWGQYGIEYEETQTTKTLFPQNQTGLYPAKLIERYQPVDAESIMDFVTDETSYEELCGYLKESIESLSYNYYQYRQFQNIYKVDKTNLRYYIITGDQEDNSNIYTNIPGMKNELEAERYIRNLGKHIYYDAHNLSFDTDTLIGEEEFTGYLNEYEYAFTDNYKIMIGIDTAYPNGDGFANGYHNYNVVMPYIEPFIILLLISVVLYLLCFVIITSLAGKTNRNSMIQLTGFDLCNTECSVFVAVMICAATGIVAALSMNWLYEVESNKFIFIIGAVLGILSFHIAFMYFYLSLVRRIKAKSLWKNSLTRKIIIKLIRFIRFLFRQIKKIFFRMCDNGSTIARTWIPYLLFLLINLIFVLSGWTGIGIVFLFDLVIGMYLFAENKAKQRIISGVEQIKEGDMSCQIDTKGMHGDVLFLANAVNTMGDAVRHAVETSMKDERLKADLITNVSHDIKTPLTSIINYVNLLKRENIEDENVKKYIEILESKSQRLKQLTEDLVEASKISSGNVTLQITRLNFIELLNQTLGEFSENFEKKNLSIVLNIPDQPVVIEADSRHIWRVIENLFKNVEKYAMENTRVYIDISEEIKNNDSYVTFSVKNISRQPLNFDANDLTERFIRGDVARSTEGSGLGLSIAKDLTQLQGGTFEIYLDGDLFKIMLSFRKLPA